MIGKNHIFKFKKTKLIELRYDKKYKILYYPIQKKWCHDSFSVELGYHMFQTQWNINSTQIEHMILQKAK